MKTGVTSICHRKKIRIFPMLAQGGQRPVSSVLSFRGRNSPPLLVPGAVPRLPRIISSGGSYGSACSSRGGSCPCLEILCPGEIKNVGPRLRRILTGKALTDVRHLGWAACPGAMCSPAEALKFLRLFLIRPSADQERTWSTTVSPGASDVLLPYIRKRRISTTFAGKGLKGKFDKIY